MTICTISWDHDVSKLKLIFPNNEYSNNDYKVDGEDDNGNNMYNKIKKTWIHSWVQGVLKKRPNFANHVQIVIFAWCDCCSSLVHKFWQHTAASRILLHGVLVELQPQKPRSVDPAMEQFEEQDMCLKFGFILGITFVETFELLKQAYREECMSCTQCYKWFKHFKEGRTTVSEDPRSGRQPCWESSWGDSRKSLFDSTDCWGCGHKCRIMPCNFNQKTTDALHHCKIYPSFADWWAKREPSHQ